MNAVATSAVPQQVQPSPSDTTIVKIKHWSQLRSVRGIAGVVVLGLGGLTGFALAVVASTFTAALAAGAVSMVLAGAVYGYVRSKSQAPFSPFATKSISSLASANPTPATTTVTGNSISDALISDALAIQEHRAQRMLAMHGYHLYPSSRDGNCFYDAIAHQCPTTVVTALELRLRVAEFARAWLQCHPQVAPTFTAVEGRAYARLRGDVAYAKIRSGLEEIGTPDCYADQIDAYFAARLLARPIVIINILGEVTFAVDENGVKIDWLSQMSPQLIPANTIVLVHDQNHFMGVDPKVSLGADVQTRQWATQNERPRYRKRRSATKLPLPE